ncbi:MAG: hypothetical protein E7414_06235, partial [Ruminococcaceae bacterium]|nr:hypothetical protein [Oscillospiraceae bacterium]
MKHLAGMLLGLALLLFAAPAAAGQAEVTEDILQETLEQASAVQTQGFDFAGIAEQAAAGELEFTLEGVLSGLGNMLLSGLKENISLLIKMVVLSVLAGVLCNLQQNLPGEGVAEISFLACLAMIAGLSATVVSEMMELALSTIDALMLFMQSLMPVMGSLAITGNAAGLAGFYPALFLSMQSFTFLCKNFFLPLIMTITALSVVNAMSSRFHITRLIDFTRQAVKWGIGLLLTIFVGILT